MPQYKRLPPRPVCKTFIVASLCTRLHTTKIYVELEKFRHKNKIKLSHSPPKRNRGRERKFLIILTAKRLKIYGSMKKARCRNGWKICAEEKELTINALENLRGGTTAGGRRHREQTEVWWPGDSDALSLLCCLSYYLCFHYYIPITLINYLFKNNLKITMSKFKSTVCINTREKQLKEMSKHIQEV